MENKEYKKKMKIWKKSENNSQGKRASDHLHLANTRVLTRIITYLSEVGMDNITNMSENISAGFPHVKDGINFLVNYHIVIKTRGRSGGDVYYLNPLFKR